MSVAPADRQPTTSCRAGRTANSQLAFDSNAVHARRIVRWKLLGLALVVLAIGLSVVITADDPDHVPNVAGLTRSTARAFSGLSWPLLACLLAVCVLHYLAAAIAVRAASGVRRLRAGELITAQLAAAAANRVTPAGLGGASLIARFLCRRGRLSPAQATAAVSSLAVLGAVADAVAFAGLVLLGDLLHLSGASAEIPLLVSRLAHLVPVPVGTSGWIALAVVAPCLCVVCIPAARTSRAAVRALRGGKAVVAGVVELGRHPGRVATLMAASAATTSTMAAGFAVAAVVGPAHLPVADVGAIMVGYMVAAAASNAVPTPGGIGTADAALTGVLLAGGAAAGPALASALAFRIVTFWAPAVAGLPAARALRRRGAL